MFHVEQFRARSSSGRALHSHCRGKGFESPRVHQAEGDWLVICDRDIQGLLS